MPLRTNEAGDEPLDRHAHETGRRPVRSDAVEVAAERRLFEQVVDEQRDEPRTYIVRGIPSQSPAPRSVRSVEIPVMIDWLSVYQTTMPDTTAAVPSVTISEFTPILATVVPGDDPRRMHPRATARSDREHHGYAEPRHEPGAQHLGEARDRPDREVELAADQREHDRERQHADHRLVAEDVLDVRRRGEHVGRLAPQAEEHEHDDEAR